MTELFLVRHPVTDVMPGTCYGRTDVGLAEPPELIAGKLRPHLPAEAQIVSSPLSRSLKLALCLGKPAVDERLCEINFGDWEMRSYADIERHQIDAWAAHPLSFRPPGGETAGEMAARAVAALEDWLQDEPSQLIVVSHGGPLRAIAGHVLGLPQERWLSLEFACGYASKLHLIPGWGAQLKWFNRRSD